VRVHDDGLRLHIADHPNTTVGRKTLDIFRELAPEIVVFYAVDRPLKPQPRIVKGHPRPLGPQMGMVVGTIKNIVNTVGFADTPEESAHKAAVLDLKMTKMEIRHEKKKQNELST